MRRLLILAMISTAGCVGACETLRGGPDEGPDDGPMLPALEAAAEQMAELEQLRQRRVDEPIEIVIGDPLEGAEAGLESSVAQEWDLLRWGLFNDRDLQLDARQPAWSQKARFDAANGQIIVSANPQADEETAFAFSMAANEGLEFVLFEGMVAETVDQWFGREILRRAGPAFVSALWMAGQADLDVTVDELAQRPEISPFIPVIGERLSVAQPEERDGANHFEEALPRVILREALAAGAALYRAGDWSALEWGRIEPPNSSNYALRPDRWFGGDGQGQWDWPEAFDSHRDETGWSEVQRGVVGPALTSIWLEGLIDTRAARTIYSGWLTDSYRIYARGDGEAESHSFHWVSAWQTPHEAQEIASAVEAVLSHYFGSENRNRRFRVAVQGVNVAVATYESDYDPEILNQEVQLLTESRFVIIPEEPAPIAFVPTLFERYVEQAGASTLTESQWLDTAAGWQVDVDSLRGWTVQKSDEAHVRWFATHEDGSMIQWTTELLNPMEPEFASQAYLERLQAAFAESIRSQEPPFLEVVDEPVDPTVEMEIIGLIDGRPLVLRLWQWRRGDVLVSYSLQGPEATFADRLVEAEAVVESLGTYGTGIGQARRPEASHDEGIIEFRVEED